jgi:hypothetical protein
MADIDGGGHEHSTYVGHILTHICGGFAPLHGLLGARQAVQAGSDYRAPQGIASASTDGIYAAMDWVAGWQDVIEAKLAARYLAPEPNPSPMTLFDLSSSWLEGRPLPRS